jgi:hypothetical protein
MSSETEATTCSSRQEHQGHLCELESQEEWDILRQVTDRPGVRCEACGGQANAARNVCLPADLHGNLLPNE